MKKIHALGLAVLVIAVIGVILNLSSRTPAYDLQLAEGDTIASWTFKGAYSGNAELEARAHNEIERLEKLIGSGEHTDYTLFVSIANQYELLGNGEEVLSYLKYALASDSETTGLAWHNAGQLFRRLGALNTANMAFEKAATVQPIDQYVGALEDFLKEYFPGETSTLGA